MKVLKNLPKFVKDYQGYVGFFWPALDYRENIQEVRTKLDLLTIKITAFCQKVSTAKTAIILPEKDVDFYAPIFKAAGFLTICLTDKEDKSPPTDVVVYTSLDNPVDLDKVIKVCSSFIFLENIDALSEVSERTQKIEQYMHSANKLVGLKITPMKGPSVVGDGNPSVILNKLLRKSPTSVLVENPYAGIPDLYSTCLVRRISDGNAFIKAVEENMPLHAVPRVELLGYRGNGGYTPYPMRGLTP